jgi:tetratricopeptide (TPR) repeat protein
MKILYVTKNRTFGEMIRSSVQRAGFEVFVLSRISLIDRYVEKQPRLILFEWGIDATAQKVFSSIVEKLPEITKWLVFNQPEDDLEVQRFYKENQFSMYWKQPLSALVLLDKIQEYRDVDEKKAQGLSTKTASQSDVYSTIDINPTVVRMIGQVWFSRSSMIISGESGKLSFAKGALIKQEPKSCFTEVLSDDFVSLLPADFSGGSWLSTGKTLRKLLLRLPPDSFLLNKLYPVCPHISEIETIFPMTKKQWACSKGFYTIQELSKASKFDVPFAEMYTMWLLGLLPLKKDQPKVIQEHRRKKEKEKKDAQSGSLGRRGRNAYLIREYERLKNEDPFVILGLAKDSTPELVRATLNRLMERYTGALEQDRESAQNMIDLVQGAADRILVGDVGNSDIPEHEKFFRYGLRAMEKGNWANADKAFTKAYQLCIEDNRILAHLGWARYHNEELEEQARTDEALENLQLALHLDNKELDTLVFISKIYFQLGEFEKALRPIRKASGLTSDAEIQKLRQDIEQAAEKAAQEQIDTTTE